MTMRTTSCSFVSAFRIAESGPTNADDKEGQVNRGFPDDLPQTAQGVFFEQFSLQHDTTM
jgi:hypothetical protein